MINQLRFCFLFIIFTLLCLPSLKKTYAAGFTVPAGGSFDINDNIFTSAGDITNEGTLAQSTGMFNISGHWTNNGVFNSGIDGTVSFTGSTRSILTGANTFVNFICTQAGKQFVFEADTTQTVSGMWTLTGGANSLISLLSSTQGTQWSVNPSGTRNISFVDVKDSRNTDSEIINPTNSFDRGNNTNWFDTPPDLTTPTTTTTTTTRTTPTTTTTTLPLDINEIKADFEANPTFGVTPLEVKFTDTSTGDIDLWSWVFGDGGSSTDQNPTHTYKREGLFSVKLSVVNTAIVFASDTKVKDNLIDVKESIGLQANFTVDNTLGFVPLEVKFTDLSNGNPSGWLWKFGDGDQSEEQNPTHIYQRVGLFSVTLTVTNGDESDTIEKLNLINVSQENIVQEDIVAAFNAEPTVGLKPLTVKFTDLSEPVDSITSWLWEFGDGANSSSQNPQHDYDLEGFYTVKLTVGSNSGENDVNIKTNLVIVKSQGVPIADFSATPTAGLVPISVKFSDLSEPDDDIASWIWDFGDGATSIEQNPTHTYKTEGIRTVKLTVSNSNGADTETKVNLIGARNSSAPIAEFIATPAAGQAPFKVTFTDNSASESITSWIWDFGDGATSTEQNPTHIYTVSGTFNVKLAVSGSSGTGEETKTNLIRVVEAGQVVAAFSANPVLGQQVPFTVQFLDNSVGDITLWEWDFGDGNTNTGQDQKPIHTYDQKGTYDIKLKVTAGGSNDSVEKEKLVVITDSTSTPMPTPTPISPIVTSLTVIPPTLARSKELTTVTVFAFDQNGNTIEGVNIKAFASGRNAVVTPIVNTTDKNGKAIFRVNFRTFRKISEVVFFVDDVSASVKQN